MRRELNTECRASRHRDRFRTCRAPVEAAWRSRPAERNDRAACCVFKRPNQTLGRIKLIGTRTFRRAHANAAELLREDRAATIIARRTNRFPAGTRAPTTSSRRRHRQRLQRETGANSTMRPGRRGG
ncbi:hypothetical protein A8H35_24275 [Burkholderia thailandensis]|nr:hypothetical protein A8H35_24275 [Burkholderia thailandensis]